MGGTIKLESDEFDHFAIAMEQCTDSLAPRKCIVVRHDSMGQRGIQYFNADGTLAAIIFNPAPLFKVDLSPTNPAWDDTDSPRTQPESESPPEIPTIQ